MANNNSAKKRIKVNKRNQLRNNIYKSRIKTFTKKYLNFVQVYRNKKTEDTLFEVQSSLKVILSQLDKAGKRDVYHKNNIARRKSALVKVYNNLL
ncbi:unnamed protein product [Dictyota dichotoma]